VEVLSPKVALKGVKNAHGLFDNVIPQSMIRLIPEGWVSTMLFLMVRTFYKWRFSSALSYPIDGFYASHLRPKHQKGKSVHVTGRGGGPWGCETSRFPHFLDSRLTNGDEVVSLTRLPAALYPQEGSWYSFLLEAESTQ
jgi:hypothetical protein